MQKHVKRDLANLKRSEKSHQTTFRTMPPCVVACSQCQAAQVLSCISKLQELAVPPAEFEADALQVIADGNGDPGRMNRVCFLKAQTTACSTQHGTVPIRSIAGRCEVLKRC